MQQQMLTAGGFTQNQVAGLIAGGGQVARGAGAHRGAGSRLNLRLAGDIQRAAAMGVIAPEQIIEATGQEGPAGYQAMAQTLTEATFNLMQTGVGRSVLAIAGEQEGGRYTGRVNRERLAGIGNMDPRRSTPQKRRPTR